MESLHAVLWVVSTSQKLQVLLHFSFITPANSGTWHRFRIPWHSGALSAQLLLAAASWTKAGNFVERILLFVGY